MASIMADFSKLGTHTLVFIWTKSAGIMRKTLTDNTSMVNARYPSTANKNRETGTAFNLNLWYRYSVDLLNFVFSVNSFIIASYSDRVNPAIQFTFTNKPQRIRKWVFLLCCYLTTLSKKSFFLNLQFPVIGNRSSLLS